MAEISLPAWPMPIQNTNVVMYIAHIWGVRLPAAPIPVHTWYAHAENGAARPRPTRHIQAKYLLPGMPTVRMTSRLTSDQVADVGVVSPGALISGPSPRRHPRRGRLSSDR